MKVCLPFPCLYFRVLATSAYGRPPSQPDPYKANMANIKLLFVTLCVKRAYTRLAWSFGVQGSQGKTKTKGWLIKVRQFGPFFLTTLYNYSVFPFLVLELVCMWRSLTEKRRWWKRKREKKGLINKFWICPQTCLFDIVWPDMTFLGLGTR